MKWGAKVACCAWHEACLLAKRRKGHAGLVAGACGRGVPLAAGVAWGMRAKVTSLLGLALWASWIAGQSRPIVVGEAFFWSKRKGPFKRKIIIIIKMQMQMEMKNTNKIKTTTIK